MGYPDDVKLEKWIRGHHGKGRVLATDEVILWRVDDGEGLPLHVNALSAIGRINEPFIIDFGVTPDGCVRFYRGRHTAEAIRALAAVDGLKPCPLTWKEYFS